MNGRVNHPEPHSSGDISARFVSTACNYPRMSPMSVDQMLAFHHEQALASLEAAEAARANANWPLAIFNWKAAARNHFMRGLTGWRTRRTDPTDDVEASRRASDSAVTILDRANIGAIRSL